MLFFNPIAYVDTLPVTARLLKYRPKFVADFDSPTSRLTLRDAKGETELLTGPDPWNSARALMHACRKIVVKMQGMTDELGAAHIEMLPPGSATEWARRAAAETERFHVPLATNPGAWLYAGTEAISPAVGHLTWASAQVLAAAVNHGEFPRYHLVLDLKRIGP